MPPWSSITFVSNVIQSLYGAKSLWVARNAVFIATPGACLLSRQPTSASASSSAVATFPTLLTGRARLIMLRLLARRTLLVDTSDAHVVRRTGHPAHERGIRVRVGLGREQRPE